MRNLMMRTNKDLSKITEDFDVITEEFNIIIFFCFNVRQRVF